nr:hypothetical protein [Tanacetum cinerariifolium]
MQEGLLQFKMQKVWVLVDLPHGKRAIGHTQEEGIDYEEVFAPIARIEATRLFLAYASFIGFMVYQMDVKSAFPYRTIEEEVYVCQPPVFEDPDYPDKTSVAVKKVNDVTRLQALVDKKKVIITETTLRDALCLDDAEGIECLPNEEIFAELARMGYEKPSTKLTFYKAFFSKTPLFEGMIVEQPVGESTNEVHDEGVLDVGVAAEGDVSAANDEVPTAVEESSIPSPTPPTSPPQPTQDQPSTSQGMTITDMDADVDVILEDAKEVAVEKSADVLSMQDDEVEPVELQEVMEVVTTAKLITKVVTAASTIITTAAPQLTIVAAPTLTTAPSAARRRNRVVIRDPEESATPFTIINSEAKSKDKGKGNLRKQKEDNVVKRYQALKRKPQTEAQARKNMMIYLRNVAGFKIDYFKGMTYDDISLIFEKHFNSNVAFLLKIKEQMDEEDSRALKRISESQEDKVSKKQKLDEEVEELKRHLKIVPNDEDDVYIEATPLARKIPVVDYEIYNENNKPYYKIKRANGSHQLYLSFHSMLRNFNREDLEVLWTRYTSLNLEKSEKCSWSSEGQELEVVRVLWCADHHIHYNTVDFAGREEISTYKVHSGSDAQ